jgi:CubicO group peptidase (beta-lactamase class C family)
MKARNLGSMAAIAAAIPLALSSCFSAKDLAEREGPTRGSGDAEIVELLTPIREKYGVPAMALAVVGDDGVKRAGVAGVRKAGTGVLATLDDSWHLGSCTKAMTATLAGILVDDGKLKWTTTMAEAFPEFSNVMHSAFRDVTLAHLLSHRAGLPADMDYGAFEKSGDVRAQRSALARKALGNRPEYEPGSTYLYSNVGYVIAGAVIERTVGVEWEKAVKERIFEPLGMQSAGFGGLGTPGLIDQPWGHLKRGKPVSKNGPDVDNPPILGPAGRVHCTIQDWGLFVADQLRGARGEAGLLKPETYAALATPPFGGDYALGWGVYERAWADGRALTHSGCNVMNFCTVWIAPERGFAILVCCNLGEPAAEPVDAAVGAAIVKPLRDLAP